MKNYVNLMIKNHPALEVCRGDVESAVEAVLTMHKNGGKLLLCGGADVKITAGIAEALKEQLPDVEIIFGGTVGFDPAVVRGMAECDAVVMIEQLDKSVLSAAVQLTARAKSMNKPVLGVITTR